MEGVSFLGRARIYFFSALSRLALESTASFSAVRGPFSVVMVKLTINLYLVQRLKIHMAIPPLPHKTASHFS